jgi:hypothetical protein
LNSIQFPGSFLVYNVLAWLDSRVSWHGGVDFEYEYLANLKLNAKIIVMVIQGLEGPVLVKNTEMKIKHLVRLSLTEEQRENFSFLFYYPDLE